MRQDTRMSRVLHVLLHMAETDQPMRSQDIAEMLQTNPVVVRRIMAGLREGGYLSADRGHGGGWRLARRPEEITLGDVYACLGTPELFAFGLSNPTPECLVEQAVNATLCDTVEAARQAILDRFAEIKLSDIRRDFEGRRDAYLAEKAQENAT